MIHAKRKYVSVQSLPKNFPLCLAPNRIFPYSFAITRIQAKIHFWRELELVELHETLPVYRICSKTRILDVQ